MNSRQPAKLTVAPLLDLIERRFDLRMPDDVEHLRIIVGHYQAQRELLLWEHGEAGALAIPKYAKAVLISEAARLMLREIDPWPRRKQNKKGNS